MIQAEKKWLFARAAERGYTEKEVMPCVWCKVTRDIWVIDVDHPAYPAITRKSRVLGRDHS